MHIQLSKTRMRHTSTISLSAESKLDETPQITDKTKKEGGHFWWPPSSWNRNVIPRRSSHPARIMIDAPLRTFEFGPELEYLCHAVKS